MRTILFVFSTVLVFGVINALVIQKERVLANGQTVYLRLAPVDPRSLMQGDYMSLRYSDDTFPSDEAFQHSDGKIVLALNDQRVATFRRFDDGRPLLPDEILLRYKNRGGVRITQDSFFIQEGTDYLYSGARYAQIKVTRDGENILVGLCDEQFTPLGPRRR